MKTIFNWITLAMFALFLQTSAVHAEYLYAYEDIDTNTDGWLTIDEANQRVDLVKNWGVIDGDKDGYVSIDEYLKYESAGLYAPVEDDAAPF